MTDPEQRDTGKNMGTNGMNNLTGHFLIAMPSLNDGFFNQSVTYICEHDESGSFGIIINQESEITLGQVIEEMKIDVDGNSNGNYHKDQAVFIMEALLTRVEDLSYIDHKVNGSLA